MSDAVPVQVEDEYPTDLQGDGPPPDEAPDPVMRRVLAALADLKEQRDKAERWHNNLLYALHRIAARLLCAPDTDVVLAAIADLQARARGRDDEDEREIALLLERAEIAEERAAASEQRMRDFELALCSPA